MSGLWSPAALVSQTFICTHSVQGIYQALSPHPRAGNSLKEIKTGTVEELFFVFFFNLDSHLSGTTVLCCLMSYVLNSKYLFHLFVHFLDYFRWERKSDLLFQPVRRQMPGTSMPAQLATLQRDSTKWLAGIVFALHLKLSSANSGLLSSNKSVRNPDISNIRSRC